MTSNIDWEDDKDDCQEDDDGIKEEDSTEKSKEGRTPGRQVVDKDGNNNNEIWQ